MRQNSVRRRLATGLAVLIAAGGLAATTMAGPAVAAPGDNGDDGEGGSKSLIQKVEDASKGYVEAKEALDTSKGRQAKLVLVIKNLDQQLGPRQAELDKIAAQSYRTGRLGTMGALINASGDGGANGMLDRVQTLQTVAIKQDAALRDLKDTRDQQVRAKTSIDTEIADQQKQLTVMAKRKSQAEAALKAAGQGQDAGSPGGGGKSAKASPGGNLSGGCTVNDPTSGGCITPRLLHAMNEAKKAGFTHYVHCWRTQNSGEHPKGRACDFAADKGGFGGVASGSSRTYGNNLANYFINNSSTLGVLYVIWFKRIWLPSSGWKSYSGAGGDPSSDHTNHVHLSVK
ncbi:coiled-coil domain-containing protein [Actinoplanes sp. NPDC049265]|uniref:coiled-coil domain-containing protein n=1 Tax=Actinoplanes sp. NPDC049265 TaxID=3363902 RepID=UPI0037125B65